ncbi:MAG: hypothetical protein ACE5GJ_06925 [Gemmatimonadota bacterium]
MSDSSPHDPRPHERVSAEEERARALAEVMRYQEERIREAAAAERTREKKRRIRRGVLAALWAGSAYLWIFAPSWTNVTPPPEPTVAEEAQALRLNLFLQSQQIEAFRLARGRLPWVLQEAGPPFPGVRYHRKDNRSYELTGGTERVELAFESEVSPLDFVGPAADLLTVPPEAREGAGP